MRYYCHVQLQMKAGIMQIINAAFCTSWKKHFSLKISSWIKCSFSLWAIQLPTSCLRSNGWTCWNYPLFHRDVRDTKGRDAQLPTLACLAVRVRHYFSFINTQLISFWLNLELGHDRIWLFPFAFSFFYLRNCPLCPQPHMSNLNCHKITVLDLGLLFLGAVMHMKVQ